MTEIDTSSINLNMPQIKSILKSYNFGATRTNEELLKIKEMYELKWERIQGILNDPYTSEADKQRYREKVARIVKKYFIVKKWLEGVRP